jgi:hypothetical protein
MPTICGASGLVLHPMKATVTALEHCITTKGEAHRYEYCIHENSKLKRKEGKEAAKGVLHSKIDRAWVNLGSADQANRGPTPADASPHPIRQHYDHSLQLQARLWQLLQARIST